MLLASAGLLHFQAAAGSDAPPTIQSIVVSGAEVVVTVQVPPGVRKVSLESRVRLGAGAWVPRAVQRFGAQGGTAIFHLPKSADMEMLRVRADTDEPLPAEFYAGKQQFQGPASTSASPVYLRNGAVDDGAAVPGAAEGGGDASRTVVESDIWRLEGDTLYFFNTYRGLQVIDLGNPDAPAVRGTLSLPAAGEQLYVIQDAEGADRVVLLARDGCGWDVAGQSQVMVINPATSTPQILATAKVPGYIVESRLVGRALYVASQSYRRTQTPPKDPSGTATEQWEYGTVVSSFDLADPAAPATRDELWFPGYGNTIAATDRVLFVVMTENGDWWRAKVQLVDIASPDGKMALQGVVRPAGRVADKFKLNLRGDVFTVISEVSRWSETGRQASVLETFSLADPLAPAKLGQVEVGHGEGLYATRFDGDRAYIVTFLRIDPLWIVDLSDPARPRVLGELETPGWSNYIQPLGDRLVTVGIDNQQGWRATVALFDVADPAKPALLAKVPLGDGSSSSEANYDEKAFTVLPDAGLILVPYQGWNQDGYAARVQLIDLKPDTLTPRGVIEHAMQPRRATLHRDRVLSISGRELFSVDATDRDQPKVVADLELSWAVDRVVPVNGHLLEIATGYSWSGQPAPAIHVVSAVAPDAVLNQVSLPETLPVLGTAYRDNVLFVAQGETRWEPVDPAKPDGDQQARGVVILSTFGTSELPKLEPLGTVKADVAALSWGGELQALWPKPGVLVLGGAGQGYWWGPWVAIDAPVAARGGLWWPGWGGGTGRFVAFDVNDPGAPKFLSDLSLGQEGQWWGASGAFLADGLVFQSHQAAEFIEGVTLPGQPPPQPYEVVKPDGTREKVTPPVGIWVTKYFLHVVDYADPANPTVRPSVNLPGSLIGVAPDASLLYTSGAHWDEKWQSDGLEYLDVSAYDGVAVTLAASLKLPTDWPRATAVAGKTVLLARPATAPAAGGLIEAWELALDRTWVKRGELKLEVPAQVLQPLGDVLAVQSDRDLLAVDTRRPEAMQRIGRATTGGCLWPTLTHAVVQEGQNVWVPLGDYGVIAVPLSP